MSRSGYNDDCSGWDLIRWRGRVASATRGKRGQAMFRDLLAALDAMPVKELAAHTFETDGKFCTLGVLGHARGIDLKPLEYAGDEANTGAVGKAFDIAAPLAAEIMFENDQDFSYRDDEAPAHRWARMRAWVASQMTTAPAQNATNGQAETKP